ncbi:MAG TPA: GRAM domain-containing protein [Jiangellaceae bacterium]|nr:GRAM domain-containing protein [Jiangellaceae bacterium]
MSTQNTPDENVLKTGNANMQRGLEQAGGKLTLTDQRLLFEAHKVNFNSKSAEVPLSAVREVTPVWTKFLGAIPLMPNSLAVTTADGHKYRFVVTGREAWKQEIEQALGR